MKNIDLDGASLSERKYERLCTMIFSFIPSSLLMFDSNLRVVIANKNFLEKSRRMEEDTIGRELAGKPMMSIYGAGQMAMLASIIDGLSHGKTVKHSAGKPPDAVRLQDIFRNQWERGV